MKLKLKRIRKSPKSNYYCFASKEGAQKIIQSALLELVKTFPSKHKVGFGIGNWFNVLDKKYGEPTEEFIPIKDLFDRHFSFENDALTIDILFSEKKVHLIINTANNIQEEISKIFRKYIKD